MATLVLDASASLALLLDENGQGPAIDAKLRGQSPIAPTLWRLETTHVLLNRERRQLLTRDEVDQYLQILDNFQIDLIPTTPSSTALATLARRHQLSAYDAAYLDLALTQHIPILTLDKNLITAANLIGLQLV